MYELAMSGQVGSDPSSPLSPAAALMKNIDLAFRQTFDAVFGDGIPIASTTLSPFIPSLGAVVAVRAIAIRACDGQSLTVLLTSGKGTDQAIPVSDLLILRTQNSGDEITAIKIIGTGQIEYLLAGNKTA